MPPKQDTTNDFAHVTGNNPKLSHRRVIRVGGSGEVHEVYSRWELLLTFQVYNHQTYQVRSLYQFLCSS